MSDINFGYDQEYIDMIESMSDEELAELNAMFTPRVVDQYFKQTPTPAQQLALSLYDKEMFWGGAAGRR